jgi:chromosome segregation ATPase
MNNKNDIFLDAQSGISIEEQKEILAKINEIGEKNRKSLSVNAQSGKPVIAAKKNGSLFPLAVNITAFIILAAGVFLLISVNGRTDAQARTGNGVYNLAEKALIDEIRKDTAEKIAAKDNKIALITQRLAEIDNELFLFYSGNQNLNAEQRASGEKLLEIQKAYRDELAILQDDRVQILENARLREERIRIQLDERTRDFAVQQRTTGELNSAMRELERLTNEQERMLALEALIMSVNSNGSENNEGLFELMAKNTELQETINEMQKTIDALGSGGTGLSLRISELEQSIASLRNTNTSLEQTSMEKDSRMALLENENSNYTSIITQLRSDNTAKDQEIASLRSRIARIEQAIQD